MLCTGFRPERYTIRTRRSSRAAPPLSAECHEQGRFAAASVHWRTHQCGVLTCAPVPWHALGTRKPRWRAVQHMPRTRGVVQSDHVGALIAFVHARVVGRASRPAEGHGGGGPPTSTGAGAQSCAPIVPNRRAVMLAAHAIVCAARAAHSCPAHEMQRPLAPAAGVFVLRGDGMVHASVRMVRPTETKSSSFLGTSSGRPRAISMLAAARPAHSAAT